MSEKRELSRADIARLRHEKKNSQRVTTAVVRAHRPLPPVTKRASGLAGTYIPQKYTKQQTTRRFNIAIGMPDVRLHAPTLPHIRVGWRLLSFFLTLLFGAATYLAWNLPTFRVVEPQVTGNSRLSAAEINAVLNLAGQPIFTLIPDDLATRLRLNYPELASAQVKVGLPNQIYVRVSERQPVILWQQGEGFTWIDATGVAFRPRGDVAGLIPVVGLVAPPVGLVPVDDPLSPPPYMSVDLVSAIQTLAPSMPVGTPIIYDAYNGLGWTDSRGWSVFFGINAKDMALKMRVYQALVASTTARGLSPVFISVARVDAPYYRMEP
ncbi:MAG: FtsQ-type POTRA domain-containing protein [Anaerolineales bacterium]|nr:FtsQ-type POTRA domain-containing protein [Anaerolineales bacterium]